MENNEKIDKLANALDKLNDNFKDFVHETSKKAYEDKIEKLKSGKEPWWSTLTKFFALPAAIVLLILNFNQTGNVSKDTELKDSQIDINKLEVLSKRLKLITDSVSVQKIQTVEDRLKLKNDVNDIKNIVDQIRDIKSSNNINLLISKFMILYLFFVCIGLFMRIFRFLWHNLFDSLYKYLGDKLRKVRWETRDRDKENFYEKRLKYLEWGFKAINEIPSIVIMVLDFLVVTLVAIPIFNIISNDLGSKISFNDILNSIKHLDFVEAVKKIEDIIF